MADEPQQDPPESEPTEDPKPDPPKDDYPEDLGDAGKKALDAERKARRDAEAKLKDLEPMAAKAKELEDAQKTDHQKLTEQLEAAKADGSKSATELLRLDVALETAPEGMSAPKIRKLAKRLTGSTREELESDAAELFAEFAGEGQSVVPASRRQGGGAQAPTQSPDELADAVMKRQRGY